MVIFKILDDFPNYRIYEDGRVQNIISGKVLTPPILTKWHHIEYGEYYCSAAELVRQLDFLNLKDGCLTRVRRGERSQYRGWRVGL